MASAAESCAGGCTARRPRAAGEGAAAPLPAQEGGGKPTGEAVAAALCPSASLTVLRDASRTARFPMQPRRAGDAARRARRQGGRTGATRLRVSYDTRGGAARKRAHDAHRLHFGARTIGRIP
jgi:hypothetical protein